MATATINKTVRMNQDVHDALMAILKARNETFMGWVNRMARHETTDAATRPEKEAKP